MLAGIATVAGDDTADVGQEPLRAGVPHVVLDHLVHGLVDVAVLLAQLLVGGRGGRRQRPDAADGALERLAHEGGGQPGGETGQLGGQAAADLSGQ